MISSGAVVLLQLCIKIQHFVSFLARRLENIAILPLVSPNIMRAIKLGIGWMRHVAHIGDKKCIQNFGQKSLGEETTWKTTTQMGE
jgi:hypothetical protein